MGVVVVVLVARRKKKIIEVCLVGRYYWLRNEVQTNVSDRTLTDEISDDLQADGHAVEWSIARTFECSSQSRRFLF
jgi:hypothetical protein